MSLYASASGRWRDDICVSLADERLAFELDFRIVVTIRFIRPYMCDVVLQFDGYIWLCLTPNGRILFIVELLVLQVMPTESMY